MSVKGGVHRAFRIAGVLVVAIALAACSRAQQQPKEYGVGGEGPIAPGTSRDFAVNVGDVVRFEVDSSSLTGEAQGILRNQAVWLNQYPQYTVTIEGHADERGTREYNIALGARRATAVRGYPCSAGRERKPHPHDLLRQGAADRGVRRHLLLVAESPGADHPQQRRGGELLAALCGPERPARGRSRPEARSGFGGPANTVWP